MPNVRSRVSSPAAAPSPPRRRGRRLLVALLAFPIAFLFSLGSATTASAAPAAVAAPELLPADVPIAGPVFSAGCLYIPHSAYGDVIWFFCPTTDPPVYTSVIVYYDDKYQITDYGALVISGQRPGDNYWKVKAGHAAWNGYDCKLLRFMGHVNTCKNSARLEAKKKPPPNTGRSLTDFLKTDPDEVDSPCDFITAVANGAGKCIDPRKDIPCPTDVLADQMLRDCESVNAEVYAARNLTPVTDASQTCDAGSAFCGNDVTAAPIPSSADSDDQEFLDAPIRWTSERLREAVSAVSIWWILAPEPLITDGGATGINVEQNVNFLVRHTNVITLGLVALSIIVASVRMVLTRQIDHARQVAYSILVLLLVSGLSVLVINALVTLSAWYCIWILVRGLKPTSSEPLTQSNAEAAAADAFTSFTGNLASMNFILMVLLSLCLIAGGLVQWAYMTARIPLVTLLAGTLPLAAAATNTEAGKTWMSRHLTYLAAFIFIKPAAVTVFVASARLFGDASQQPGADSQFRAALILLLMSLLLPALIRMIFPIVTPATGGQEAATAIAGGVLAGGARLVRRS